MLKFDIMILTAILLSSLPHSSIQDKTFYYESAKNIFCADYKEGCSFNISSAYPFSPKIPTNIIKRNRPYIESSTYLYSIFLIFHKPKDHFINFFLMAYDTSNGKTIISNGDYYDIFSRGDTDYNKLKIYKEIKDTNFIQLLFLGIEKNIQYQVDILFEWDFSLDFFSFSLDDYNSYNSNDNEKILPYIQDYSLRYEEAIERTHSIMTFINDILKQAFDVTITFKKVDLFDSETIYIPPFIILTTSYSVALETSASKFFKPEKYILSDSKFAYGKLNYHMDGIDLLKKDENIKDKTILKTFELYKKRIENTFLECKLLENEIYSITVSTNGAGELFITICFSQDLKFTEINASIEFKIKINNPLLLNLALSTQANIAIAKNFVEEKQVAIINGIICFLIITAIAVSGGIAVGGAAAVGGGAAAVGGGAAAGLTGLINLPI